MLFSINACGQYFLSIVRNGTKLLYTLSDCRTELYLVNNENLLGNDFAHISESLFECHNKKGVFQKTVHNINITELLLVMDCHEWQSFAPLL